MKLIRKDGEYYIKWRPKLDDIGVHPVTVVFEGEQSSEQEITIYVYNKELLETQRQAQPNADWYSFPYLPDAIPCIANRWMRRRTINSTRISLHKVGSPAILYRRMASNVGDKQGAYEKCDIYAPLNWVPILQTFYEMGSPFTLQEIKYVQRKS